MRSNHPFLMKSVKWLLLPVCFACLSTSKNGRGPFAMVDAGRGDSQTRAGNPARLAGNYGRLPLSFEANRGQTDARVKFLARGPGYTLFLTGDEALLALRKSEGRRAKREIRNSELEAPTGIPRPLVPNLEPPIRGIQPRPPSPESRAPAILRLKLLGANPAAKVSGVEELPGKSNYFIGNDPNKWRTNVATYARVRYEGVYPGVDLVYHGNQRQLENDFVVAPGTDASQISIRVEGSKQASLDAEGNLVIAFEGGEVQFQKPLIYQEGSGARREIPGGYVLKGAREVAFKVGAYDATKALVVDPVLAYSTYLGGSGRDEGDSIAVDSPGNAYVTGATSSSNFPTTAGAFQTSLLAAPGNSNAFVTKLSPSGSALVYSTYLGGSNYDSGFGIAVDSSGNAYVIGETGSSNFPTTSGAFQTSLAGSHNAFVTKLNPSGSALVYSTYLGGRSSDYGWRVAVDSSGHAYVTGGTDSSNFPTTAGAFQTSLAGSENVFVSKLNPSGSALVYSTYLGGSGGDYGWGIALDSSGHTYVTGFTTSSDFPTTSGVFQTSLAGSYDIFVSKLNPSGSALVYSTYLGSGPYFFGFGIAVDSSGNAYVTASSSSSDFPTTAGAFQTTLAALGGGYNAIVTKLNPSGSALVYSTYLGGSGWDVGYGIAVDPSGNAYVTGFTESSHFPTTAGAFQTSLVGGQNAFVTILNPAGSSLVYSTFLGGGGDLGSDITVDDLGNAYVFGYTYSKNFPTTPGAFQTSLAGDYDTFVAKFENSPSAQLTNLQATVGNLVSAGTLSPGLGQYLLAPLNAALAALDPAGDGVPASDPGGSKVAIADLYVFINRVRLVLGWGALTPVEGGALIDAANSLIVALCGKTGGCVTLG